MRTIAKVINAINCNSKSAAVPSVLQPSQFHSPPCTTAGKFISILFIYQFCLVLGGSTPVGSTPGYRAPVPPDPQPTSQARNPPASSVATTQATTTPSVQNPAGVTGSVSASAAVAAAVASFPSPDAVLRNGQTTPSAPGAVGAGTPTPVVPFPSGAAGGPPGGSVNGGPPMGQPPPQMGAPNMGMGGPQQGGYGGYGMMNGPPGAGGAMGGNPYAQQMKQPKEVSVRNWIVRKMGKCVHRLIKILFFLTDGPVSTVGSSRPHVPTAAMGTDAATARTRIPERTDERAGNYADGHLVRARVADQPATAIPDPSWTNGAARRQEWGQPRKCNSSRNAFGWSSTRSDECRGSGRVQPEAEEYARQLRESENEGTSVQTRR